MAETAGDILADTLIAWGVDTVFGMPGDGINGIMEALRTRQDRIRFIQVRHEESAALAACGYAKWTSRLGVCLATSGPGGIHLLNGLYDAKLDGQPVLAITGLQFHDLLGTATQQDVELDKLFADACAYSMRIMGPAHAENVTEMACRTALAYRQPAHVTMPVDVQSMPLERSERSRRNVADHVSNSMARGGRLPDDAQLAKAAEILNGASKPFILAGRGALGARAELEAMAERLQAPVGMPLLGKGAVEEDGPWSVGGVGMLGTAPAQDALEGCDTLLIVGSSFPYIEYYPRPGAARAVQIDLDAKRIGLRFPVEAGLVGDSARVLQQLLPLIRAREDGGWLEGAREAMRDWRALLDERGTATDVPMKPEVVTHALNKRLAGDAIVVTDSGTITAWTARHIDIRAQRLFSCSGTLATMACGLPYAIAAAIAHPQRQVVVVIGDGGVSMLMGELATLRKYDLNVKVIVLRNDVLGMIKWEQIVLLGNPEYGCELQPIDFVKVAEGCGLSAVRIEDPAMCGDLLDEALQREGPCLIEAVVDPHTPPLPPKLRPADALHLAEALAAGTPHRGKIAMTIASDVVRQLV
jgi:pyruvate dehydrogenase (quinone)